MQIATTCGRRSVATKRGRQSVPTKRNRRRVGRSVPTKRNRRSVGTKCNRQSVGRARVAHFVALFVATLRRLHLVEPLRRLVHADIDDVWRRRVTFKRARSNPEP